MTEALALAQLQVAEEIINTVEINSGNCLHSDGTTKHHRHFQNFQVTTTNGSTLSFGLYEMAGSDADCTINALTKTLDDICDILESSSKENDFSNLVCSFKTTMSDLGPVNPLFNLKLKDIRKKLLPKVIKNWEGLKKGEQADFIEMSNFICKLHLLSNFATETDKTINSFEKLVLSTSYENNFAFNTAESGATRLIRTACKALHVRESDEAGVAG